MSLYQKIYAVVKKIPRGRVASYGRIARVVGCNARQVGYAMAATPDDDIPWHRVINGKGEVSARKHGGGDERQRRRLADEGVVFDARGRVDFDRFGWVGGGGDGDDGDNGNSGGDSGADDGDNDSGDGGNGNDDGDDGNGDGDNGGHGDG